MIIPALAAGLFFVLGLTYLAWRRYIRVSIETADEREDPCPYSLREAGSDQYLVNVPHQQGVQWLPEIFSRSAKRFPHHTALQIPHTGESLSFAELDAEASAGIATLHHSLAVALSNFEDGYDARMIQVGRRFRLRMESLDVFLAGQLPG